MSVKSLDFLSFFILDKVLASTFRDSATFLWLLAFSACNMTDTLLSAVDDNSLDNLLMVVPKRLMLLSNVSSKAFLVFYLDRMKDVFHTNRALNHLRSFENSQFVRRYLSVLGLYLAVLRSFAAIGSYQTSDIFY